MKLKVEAMDNRNNKVLDDTDELVRLIDEKNDRLEKQIEKEK